MYPLHVKSNRKKRGKTGFNAPKGSYVGHLEFNAPNFASALQQDIC